VAQNLPKCTEKKVLAKTLLEKKWITKKGSPYFDLDEA
jgi:hypothetical protein